MSDNAAAMNKKPPEKYQDDEKSADKELGAPIRTHNFFAAIFSHPFFLSMGCHKLTFLLQDYRRLSARVYMPVMTGPSRRR